MRDKFWGYYRPTDEEFKNLWEQCIFCFDANILLNVYCYSSAARERLFLVLEKLSDRIWIPYQTAQEYHKNRLKVISDQLSPYSEIPQELDDQFRKLKGYLEKYSKRHSFSNIIGAEYIPKKIQDVHNHIKQKPTSSNTEFYNLMSDDKYREKLTELFRDKVGDPYPGNRLADIYKNLEKRYESQIPPGYKDSKKPKPDCYGDAIAWLQLIDFGRSQKRPIIFVTDDNKEDWWLIHKGNTLGPRPELIQEFLAEANVHFYMYTGDKFLERAEGFLELPKEPKIIKEAEEIRSRPFPKLNGSLQGLNTSPGAQSPEVLASAIAALQSSLLMGMRRSFNPLNQPLAASLVQGLTASLKREKNNSEESILANQLIERLAAESMEEECDSVEIEEIDYNFEIDGVASS
jgi:hypothetical protein